LTLWPLIVEHRVRSYAAVESVHVVMETSTLVVVLQEDIDLVSADRLGEQLLAAVNVRPDARCLVVDLRDVAFIDSCGLRMFVLVRESLRLLGIEPFLVARPGSASARMFEITGLGRLLGVHHRLGDALEAARRCVTAASPPCTESTMPARTVVRAPRFST